jgi:antitoxin MazE
MYTHCISKEAPVQTRVRKWGNSLGLRIPKAMAEAAGVGEGTAVFVTVVRGNLVVKAEEPRRADLDDLLRRVKPANLHGEIDSGGPVGREAW